MRERVRLPAQAGAWRSDRRGHAPGSFGRRVHAREILQLLIEDYTQKAIAAALFISLHTVDTHLRNIYAKLQAHSRSGAIVKVLRARLL